MRHRNKTFKIGKSHAHRKAMLANMLVSLFTHGRIKTTVTKAKELRRWADKMVTSAKKGGLSDKKKVISTLRPRYSKYDASRWRSTTIRPASFRSSTYDNDDKTIRALSKTRIYEGLND